MDAHVQLLYRFPMVATAIITVMMGDIAPSIWLNDGKMYFKDRFPIATDIAKHAAKGAILFICLRNVQPGLGAPSGCGRRYLK
mmetsp:Transcript_9376/g.21682  ORF Transcript_9376/g.21682 Transcript_9376/m.21682 type:complete len:83 (+) Transcript_9376:589-837(+)